ncbi:putative EGF-like calcium-binding, wall-associated receptor kinase, galacturonan-binding protein [Rosa chinensis]|uniref:Putative EGF-like calcium-binding, wall-associated receptor kinase, galacturonan-binding protein n=1 Tax=Rosa chinensis TaxID=74649 RepID=A0A2P6PGB2_ROSCH|nr:putative EGF-like calcium-binding, wall-associated receptor kinase, galacturonan-binding protein [Rosa chinensis]
MMEILVHQMIFMLLLSICRASTAAPKMAKPSCPTECGNVTIPYPFGIGPNPSCYYDEWFQIDCNESTQLKPFLRRINLEVLSIFTEGRLQVNSPVTFFCEGNNSRNQVADLRDSPFVYSQSDNIFTAVSCDYFALLSSAYSIVGGCTSFCGTGSEDLDCDSGINCCQTSIPPGLLAAVPFLFQREKSTSPVLTAIEKTTDCRKFAFLVDKDWFSNTASSLSISGFTADMKRGPKVPVVLLWSINNQTRPFDLFNKFIVDPDQHRLNVHTYYGDFSRVNLSALRDPSCIINPAVNWSKIVCSCRYGFEGNPYLGEKSCDDIDECQDPDRYRCFGPNKCVNVIGSYLCVDNQRKDNRRKAKWILVAGLSSSLGLLLLLIGIWFGYKLLKKKNEIK